MPVAINDSEGPPPPPPRSGSATSPNGSNGGNSSSNNNNPSARIMHSMGSPSPVPGSGPPRTTSRRGGRSRSPVGSRVSGGSSSNPGPLESGGGGENLSSAAAAAAAAAKAYSTSSGGGGGRGSAQPWPPEVSGGDHDYSARAVARGGPPPGYPDGPHPPPSSMWPGDDGGAYPPPRGPLPPHRSALPPYPPPPPGYDRGPPPPPGFHHSREMDYDRRSYPPPPSRYDHDRSRSGGYGPPPPPPRGMMPHPSYPHDYGGARSSYPRGGPPPPPHLRYPPPPDHHPSRGGSSSSRGPPPPPYPSHPAYRGGDPSQQPPQHLPPPHHLHSPQPSSSQHQHHQQHHHHTPRGGTTMIIGGVTPIHLPKSPILNSSQSPSPPSSNNNNNNNKKERSAASVFRGRPGDGEPTTRSAPRSSLEDEDDDDDSPQKILLSLRTPSTSFEEVHKKDKPRQRQQHKMSPSAASDSFSPGDDVPRRSPEPIFETQRSGQLSKAGSIDMAPSFNLFNQSFDSFGDGHYFNVEGSLTNADSFGLGRTDSVGAEAAAQLLRKNSSTNFSTQFLAPSNSGAFTLGYSPVNSFGNASASPPRRNGEGILMVGGPDARSSSPTEVLDMYTTGAAANNNSSSGKNNSSNNNNNARPLEDSHLRMSVGSFGGHSMQSGAGGGGGYNRSPYPHHLETSPLPPPPPSYYSSSRVGMPPRPHESSMMDSRIPHFYVLLRKYRRAFQDCTFLLPGVKSALLEDESASDSEDKAASKAGTAEHSAGSTKGPAWDPSLASPPGHQHYPGPHGIYGEPSLEDTNVARRRIESSVCAFGGNLHKERSMSTKTRASDREAIFRGKGTDEVKSAAVTPASTNDNSLGESASVAQKARKKYEEDLPGRYYENDSRLSWEFEEEPPVELSPTQDDDDDEDEYEENPDGTAEGPHSPPKSEQNDDKDGDQYCQSVSEGDAASTGTGDGKAGGSLSSSQAKMRYRCKLCGQPKQNHRCPYQQSLARSIGCMVYPAVNAFTADEPGTIAAPLSEMNNFVDIQKDETSPSRPTPDRMYRMSGPMAASAQVTPESMRSGSSIGPPSSVRSTRGMTRHGMATSGAKKRMYSKMVQGGDQGDLLFVEAMELKPEQFRSVTNFKIKKSAAKPYVYASLPLPYAQRKRLSDNLFSLSNEVPKLTDECAQVLREAREKDMWDLAVAELMTQVIVIIHCNDRDHRLEGLRQYLLTLGIAC